MPDAWEIAGRELDEAKTRESRALTEQEVARRFDALVWTREAFGFRPRDRAAKDLSSSNVSSSVQGSINPAAEAAIELQTCL